MTLKFDNLTAFIGTNGAGKTAAPQALVRRFGSGSELRLTRADFHVPPAAKDDDEHTFRWLHPQYIQGDFFEKTIGDCARILGDSRARNSNWSTALDDFLGVNSVPIMTIAKSKGLEIHTVIVLGLDFAFHHPQGSSAAEECNFSVAFSRAEERVLFTFADMRNGRRQRREQIARHYDLLEAAGVSIEVIES